MNQLPDWLKIALPFIGSLLAVSVAALSAPVTANRFRLAQLDRLNTVLDKMDADDPARPYVAAEARKRAAWYTATTNVRLSIVQIGYLIFGFWIATSLVASLIWPDQVVVPPAFFWWSKVMFLVLAVAGIAGVLRRRRLERVNFYNVLIEAGPTEFTAMLRKRAFVPPLRRTPKPPASPTASLKRPDATQAGRLLEKEGVQTCPDGHPVNGRSLFVTEYAHSQNPPRKFLCGRCLKPLPKPLTQDLDELERLVESRSEMRRRKQAKREAKDKPTDEEPSTDRAGSDVPAPIEESQATDASRRSK